MFKTGANKFQGRHTVMKQIPNNRAPVDMCRLQAPNQEPTLELHSRDAPSVEAHHRVNGPDTGRNSGGRRKKKLLFINL